MKRELRVKYLAAVLNQKRKVYISVSTVTGFIFII